MAKLSKMQLWNLLTEEQRREIKETHRLPASGSKEVVNNRVVRDGVQENDLKTLDKNVLLDVLDLKEKNDNVKETKKENPEPVNEKPVQHSNRGGDTEDKPVKKPSVSEQAGNKQGQA